MGREAAIFRPRERLIPMVELEARSGDPETGFYGLHVEVPSVEPFLDPLRRFELIPPVLEERPPGRRLITARWRGLPHRVSVFDQVPPYWRLPDGRRFVAIGKVASVGWAQAFFTDHFGWTLVHQWEHSDGRKGVYLRVAGDYGPEVLVTRSWVPPEQVMQIELQVDDLRATADRLTACPDIEIEPAVTTRPNGEWALHIRWGQGRVPITLFATSRVAGPTD